MRQADPEAEPEILRQQREGIGADRVEGDVAEIEQAGEADDDVEAPAEHHIGEDQDRQVEEVAVLARDQGRQEVGEETAPGPGRRPTILPIGRPPVPNFTCLNQPVTGLSALKTK